MKDALTSTIINEFPKEGRSVDDLLAHPDDAKRFATRIIEQAHDPSLTVPSVLTRMLRLRKQGGALRHPK